MSNSGIGQIANLRFKSLSCKSRIVIDNQCNVNVKDIRVKNSVVRENSTVQGTQTVQGELTSRGGIDNFCQDLGNVQTLELQCMTSKISANLSVVFEKALGNGDDGESIAFNPNDGLLYHASGISSGDQYFETIDRTTLAVGSNLVPSNAYPGSLDGSEISALEWYEPIDLFLAGTIDAELHSLQASGGAASLIGSLPEKLKGFAVDGTKVYGGGVGTGKLYQIDPSDASEIGNVQTTLDSTNIPGINGLSICPNTGTMYILFKNPANTGGNRLLGTVDPDVGVVTQILNTGDKMADMTFDNDGKLWFVSGDGATVSSSLFAISKAICPPILVKSDLDLSGCLTLLPKANVASSTFSEFETNADTFTCSGQIVTPTVSISAGSSYQLIVSNPTVTGSSVVMATVSQYSGAGEPVVTKVEPTTGSFAIKVYNTHSSLPLNNTVTIKYVIL